MPISTVYSLSRGGDIEWRPVDLWSISDPFWLSAREPRTGFLFPYSGTNSTNTFKHRPLPTHVPNCTGIAEKKRKLLSGSYVLCTLYMKLLWVNELMNN